MYLNSFYVQKSKLMLYPLLEFANDAIFRPAQTYLAYRDLVPLEEASIICAFKRVNDEAYYSYRNDVLMKSPYFVKHILTVEYDYLVFSLMAFTDDYNHFLKGEYSKFSNETKGIILESYSRTKIGPILVDTHLNPEKYHELYANELGSDLEVLREAHETLSPPDFDKEMTD